MINRTCASPEDDDPKDEDAPAESAGGDEMSLQTQIDALSDQLQALKTEIVYLRQDIDRTINA